MIKSTSLLLLAVLLVSSMSFQIKNLKHQINPESPEEYIQYIKTMMGMFNEQDLLSNPELSKIVENQRISIFNAVEEVALILIDQEKTTEEKEKLIEDISLIKSFDESMDQFSIINMSGSDKQSIANKIMQLQKAGKLVNKLELTEQMSRQFSSHERKLQASEQPVLSRSYILKFFFSLMFIIVCLAALSAITNMDNKKQTLLYAKFIADVGR